MIQGFKFFKFNNFDSVKKLFEECENNDQKISGVLVEPIQGEGGVIPGSKIFFKSLREICDKYNPMFLSKRLTYNKYCLDSCSLTKTIVNKKIFVIIKKFIFSKALGAWWNW